MTITAAIVLFAVIWFMTLYVSLPIGMKSQGDVGDVAPGTPASAPSEFRLKRKLFWVTAITVPLWLAVMAVILADVFAIQDFNYLSDIAPQWRAGAVRN